MSAEKNVVEAARKVINTARVNIAGWICVEEEHMKALRAALSAYDSAPAPSEDRVREAAGKYELVLTGEFRLPKKGEWFADDKGEYGIVDQAAHDFEEVEAFILTRRPKQFPAPALPPGTVAVSVDTLREIRRDAVSTHTMEGYPESSCSIAKTIDALLPPPARPEPPKELVAEWERIADTLYRYQIMSPMDRPLSKETHCARTVAALRAAWEAKGGA